MQETEQQFRQGLLTIAECSFQRHSTSDVLRKLRFLTNAHTDRSWEPLHPTSEPDSSQLYLPPNLRVKNGETIMRSSEDRCVCHNYSPFQISSDIELDPNTKRPLLSISSPGELSSCKHYLAVSYVWQQPAEIEKQNERVHRYRIQSASGIRQSRAPTNILDRVIAYASMRGIKAIWIDQECIEQDDPLDKEYFVQRMDVIYSTAYQVIAVLNQPVVDRYMIRLLEHVESRTRESFYAGQNEESVARSDIDFRIRVDRARDFVERIMSDPWFQRAWPLQESILAKRAVHYLLPCDSLVARPPWMGTMHFQLVLDQWMVHEHLRNFLVYDEGNPLVHAFRDMVPVYKAPWSTCDTQDFTTHRLGSLSAYKSLSTRAIHDESDRITIVANLCRYQTRLETDVCRSPAVDLDSAIFVQAILNGDLSILLAIETPVVSRLQVNTSPVLAFSWCNVYPTTFRHILKSNSRDVCRIRPPVLERRGLICRGHLFHCQRLELTGLDDSQYISASNAYEKYNKGKEYDVKYLVPLMQTMIAACHQTGHPHLASALYVVALTKGWINSSTQGPNQEVQSHLQTIAASDLSSLHDSYRKWKPNGILHLINNAALRRACFVATSDNLCRKHYELPFYLLFRESIFAKPRPNDTTGIFIPQRVEIDEEREIGKLNHLAFWYVHVRKTGSSLPELECRGDVDIVHKKGMWPLLSFFGDWNTFSHDTENQYLLI